MSKIYGLGAPVAGTPSQALLGPNTVFLSQAGIASDADLSFGSLTLGVDQTLGLQAILDRALTQPSLTIMWDVKCSTTGLRINSNTTISALTGCGAILRDGSNRCVWLNKNIVVGPESSWIDHDITFIGGIWHGNGDKQTVKGNSTSGSVGCMGMYGVRNLRIEHTTFLAPKSYTINALHVANFDFRKNVIDVGDVNGYTNKDGCHVGGYSRNILIEGNILKCGDDGVAITSDDGYTDPSFYGPGDPTGDFFNNAAGPISGYVRILNNYFLGSRLGAIRLLSAGSSWKEADVEVSGNCGTTLGYGLCIDNFQYYGSLTAPGPGRFGKVRIANHNITVLDGNGNLRRANTMISANIDHLHLEGFKHRDFSRDNCADILLYNFTRTGNDYFGQGMGNAYVNSTIPVIKRLQISNYDSLQNTGTTTMSPCVWNDGVDVQLLEITDSAHVANLSTTIDRPLYFQTAGNLQDMQVDNVVLKGVSRGFAFVGGTVGFGISARGVLHTGANLDYTFTSMGVTIPELVASNFRGNRTYLNGQGNTDQHIYNSATLFPLISGDAFVLAGGASYTAPLKATVHLSKTSISVPDTVILTMTYTGASTPTVVDYYLNYNGQATLINQGIIPPGNDGQFSYTWNVSGGGAGTYQVYCRVSDNNNILSTSANATFTIKTTSSTTTEPPVTSDFKPILHVSPNPAPNNSTVVLTMSYTGTPVGQITEVAYFLNNSTYIGSAPSLTAPYTYNWGLGGGSGSITLYASVAVAGASGNAQSDRVAFTFG